MPVRNTVLPLLLLFIALKISAQEDRVRKFSNDFLTIGVDARAFGMGNAFSAWTEGVSSAYWNPAALSTTDEKGPELGLMHASYFANVANYNYLGASFGLKGEQNRRLALTYIRMGVDDIPNTLQLVEPDGSFNYDKLSSFSAADQALLLSYSWNAKFHKPLHLGTSVKVIHRTAGEFVSAWGFGIDVSALWIYPRFRFGVVVKDLTNTFNAWSFNTASFEDAFINTGNEIPENSLEITRPSARIGLGYDFSVGKRLGLKLALDNALYFDGKRPSAVFQLGNVTWDPHFGAELSYRNDTDKEIAFFRMGAYNLQNVKDLEGQDAFGLFPTAGVGVVISPVTLDYALANLGNFSENLHSHVISLRVQLR
ncbi:MAG: hypothetical protein AAF694_16095 [Bacteroidota bacterium]